VLVALLYGLGAHGIMTLNDFKALEGDRQMGVNSLPVTLGPERAARVACWVMALPQVVVIALLALGTAVLRRHRAGRCWHRRASGPCACCAIPRARRPGTTAPASLLYVSGMMVAAFALRGLG
jgi:chlorophyll synthase